MIGYREAVERLCGGADRLGVQPCAPGDAVGRVLAHEVVSPVALPPFDNAALDGVALVAAGRPDATAQVWEIGARIAAGQPAPQDDASAWEIMTGAPLPARADTVVPVERIEALPAATSGASRIRVQGDVAVGANIRRCGEDVQPGQCVLPAGHVLDPAVISFLEQNFGDFRFGGYAAAQFRGGAGSRGELDLDTVSRAFYPPDVQAGNLVRPVMDHKWF